MDVDVDELLEQLGVDLPSSRTVECPYPDHGDSTASFHIYAEPVGFYCFGCGRGGDALALVRAFTGCSYWEAVAWLGGIVGDYEPTTRERVEKPIQDLTGQFMREPDGGPSAIEAAERLIAKKWPLLELQDLKGFGVAVKRWALFVPYWRDLTIIGVKTKSLTDGTKSSIPGSTFTLGFYNVQREPEQYLTALLVEGESNVWLGTKLFGDKVAVYGLPSGASTWRSRWAEDLANVDWVISTDNDSAGLAAADRIHEALPRAELQIPPGKFSESIHEGWRPEL